MNANMREAMRYAGLGWRVYPVWGIKAGKCLCGGMKDCKPGKHPYGKAVPHGGKDATCDIEKLTSWFKGRGVNVGVRVDGFVVLDVENKHGGMALLEQWEQQNGKMPTTPTAESGSGGRHFYFKRPDNLLPKEKLPIASGAELLIGGDVIVPPSNHHSGGVYRWLVPPETPLAEMPEWLLSLVRTIIETNIPKPTSTADEPFDPMKGTISAGDTFAELGSLPAGNRNDALNAVIGSMLGNGFTREQIVEQGLKWADEQEPPYSVDTLTEKISFFARKQLVQVEEQEAEPLTRGCPTERVFAGSQPGNHQPDNPTPVIPDAVLYGVIGEFVKAVEPLTEADPHGVLACVLAGVGNALGRRLHHRIGRRHSGNLFVLLVGDTAARKGTCQEVAESILSPVAPDWLAGCVENGFGSGQGFVHRIRDAGENDPGIPDKRLLVIEEEWAKPLRLCRSENSILSPLIRSAFDGKPLSVMNRGENRYGCREPHVSIVGMITGGELRELVKGRAELVNGSINRFLIINCGRRQYLALGGDYEGVGERFAPKLREAMERAKAIDAPMTLDAEAGELWHAEYRRLEQPREGDYGKAVARLSVHCLKVAMLYASLDGSSVVTIHHLKPALAFVDYCDKSALTVFGKPSLPPGGSPHEESHDEEPPHAKLLNLIRSRKDGIIKRDAHALFGNHRKGDELNEWFGLLKTNGFIVEMSGRWYATGQFAEESSTGVGGKTVSAEEPANLRMANGEPSSQDTTSTNLPTDALPDGVRSSQFAVAESSELAHNPHPVIPPAVPTSADAPEERGLL